MERWRRCYYGNSVIRWNGIMHFETGWIWIKSSKISLIGHYISTSVQFFKPSCRINSSRVRLVPQHLSMSCLPVIFLQTNSNDELGFGLIHNPELEKTALFLNAQTAQHIGGEPFWFSSAFCFFACASWSWFVLSAENCSGSSWSVKLSSGSCAGPVETRSPSGSLCVLWWRSILLNNGCCAPEIMFCALLKHIRILLT